MKSQRSFVLAKKLASKANKVDPDGVAKGRKSENSPQSGRVVKVKTVGLGRRRSIAKNQTRSSSSSLKEVSKTSSSLFTLPSRDRYYQDTVQSMKDKDEWEILNKDDHVEGGKLTSVMGTPRRKIVRLRKSPKKVSMANHQNYQQDRQGVKTEEGSDNHSFLDSAASCADGTLLFIGGQVHKVVEKVISTLNQK
mmetsp:Transcript_17115/g.21644  ORF Transcript_17115/g.21644 Transcript_17115/m.21644 type:complete len:194 (-) Transcript_17115:608-1189(-)|eukprot:CAMPEP_0203651038 /NCGR_PEP_ID=MMETSP0088-20131115/26367_1 /ASSEMBLY_ACC=CAM_ASM_001087 /TAXON_ID=426623 /ORGANISM="Chaetoceros affinis, Strain CCMP159" /LENGTH=193 /DNA_ID=CAMNT_0050510031 /DNA_START=45 /DNA_END=626 /DNA_ORIENTATION=-